MRPSAGWRSFGELAPCMRLDHSRDVNGTDALYLLACVGPVVSIELLRGYVDVLFVIWGEDVDSICYALN
jgi:hypothetical protein